MAYFNDSDNFYSASATPEELDSYPFLQCQTPATTDRVYRQETQTFAGSWATVDQLGPPTITPTGLGATSYEPVPPAFGSYSAPLDGSYWSMTSRPNEPDHASSWNQDSFFASGQAWGTMMPALSPDPTPANSWVASQHGAPSYASYTNNLPNHHQSGPSTARTWTADKRRFMPYDTYHDRNGMYGNPEAGPSNKASPPFPDGDWQTAQPTGGTPETTADAEQNQTTTEDDEIPAPRTRRARGKGPPRPHRERNCGDVRKLQIWAKALWRTRKLPSHWDAITAAAEIISVFRQPVYNEDRLHRVYGHRTGAGGKKADAEWERRDETRKVYQRLSRLYRLKEGRGRDSWTMTELVSKVLEDLDIIDCSLRSGFVPT